MAGHHLVEIGPGGIVAHLAQKNAVRPHPQAGLQQRFRRDTTQANAAFGIEQPDVVFVRDDQFERVLNGDQPLMRRDCRDQGFAHCRFAAAGRTAQQHRQPVADTGTEKILDVAVVVECEYFGVLSGLGLAAGIPFVPARRAIPPADIGECRDRRTGPPDRQADGAIGDGRWHADLQTLPAWQLGRAERASRPDVLPAQRTSKDRNIFQIVVAERQVVPRENTFLPDERLARLVDGDFLGGGIVEPV